MTAEFQTENPESGKPLTYERLIEVLFYDPETGKFFWIARLSNRIHIGDEAGSDHSGGYLEVGIDGHSYLLHRLAWLYMTGKWPDGQVDHRDTVRKNIKWENLREATHGQNVQNSGPRKNNTTGYKGVVFIPQINKFHSRIMSDRKLHLLGYFDSAEEAAQAYAIKAKELHGEFARIT